MVTDAMISAFYGMVTWAASLLPSGPPPDFLTTTSGALGLMIAGASGLSAWVPWQWVIGVSTTVLAVWLAILVVKAARWLIGWVPTMGGS